MSFISYMFFFIILVVFYLGGLRSLLARPPTREEEMIKYLRRSSKDKRHWRTHLKEQERTIRQKMMKYYR